MSDPRNKDMIVTGQSLEFTHREQTDAEGQLARRRFFTQAKAGMGKTNAGEKGQLPAVVEYVGEAGAMAQAARTQCSGCRHWDPKAFARFIELSTGPASRAEDRATAKSILGRLLEAGLTVLNEDGTANEAETLKQMGICRPLTDIVEGMVGRDPFHWPVHTWVTSTCPSYVQAGPHRMEITTPAAPYGLFKPISLDAERVGAKRYDAILDGASGKVR